MSWLFSQALVEEYSAGTSLAGEPSSQLNVMPTPHKFWRNDKTIDASDLSRFGLTSQLLTDAHGEELLMSYRAASLVRTLARPALAQVSTVPEADSGRTWLGSFAKYSQSASMWKTAQCSLLADSDEFSETWPRWGSMRNGASYLRPTPALPICASESGLWPTPTVCGNHNKPRASPSAGWGLSSAVKLWPTPTATLATKGGRITPRKGREGGTLIEAVSARRWPTPTASASKGSSPGALTRKSGASRANDRIDHAVMASDGGQLNPDWVEWLMGWPIGWTELKPLAMDRFQEWQQQHGGF
jgi:hypothetical protein